jgi:hypothetical protein
LPHFALMGLYLKANSPDLKHFCGGYSSNGFPEIATEASCAT